MERSILGTVLALCVGLAACSGDDGGGGSNAPTTNLPIGTEVVTSNGYGVTLLEWVHLPTAATRYQNTRTGYYAKTRICGKEPKGLMPSKFTLLHTDHMRSDSHGREELLGIPIPSYAWQTFQPALAAGECQEYAQVFIMPKDKRPANQLELQAMPDGSKYPSISYSPAEGMELFTWKVGDGP